ncbi:MAG: MFS transporter, partial [Rhodococcus sp. (in: high G+C Gram-positive bacteria)]
GVFHDLTSGWTASFAFMTVAVAVLVTGAYQACKPRVVEDSWHAGRTTSVG